MSIELANWQLLWLLVLVLPVIYLARRSLANLSRRRWWTSLILRLLILLLLILSLSGLRLMKKKDELCVIFLLDFSHSISDENKHYAVEYVREATRSMKKDDRAGIIVFGSDAYVEIPPQVAPEVQKISSIPGKSYTDIAKALRLGFALFPEGAAKRLVLMTDGNENSGKAFDEAITARSNDVEISSVPLTRPVSNEVLLDKLILPEKVKEGEAFELKLITESFQPCKGKLRFFKNGYYIGEKRIDLKEGKNIYIIPQEAKHGGFHTYEVLLETETDTISENNRALGFSAVKGKPKLLYVEGEKGQSKFLKNALEKEGIETEVRNSLDIPVSLGEMQNYDAIVLSDVSALKMSLQQMKMLESYVKALGGGLAMAGGENSFGVGGYFKTPVEEALPVSMDVRKKKHLPSLALVILIDKSGSMGGISFATQKIALAREGAIACVELLSRLDKIGVIAFDSAAKWVVPLTSAENLNEVMEGIATIRAGGGTHIYPALKEVHRLLKETPAILKHVILLTDGMSAPGDYDGLVANMVSEKITLSTVGIGPDCDVEFLKFLAQKGLGMFYLTSDISYIPRIFTRDALIASKALIIEEPFQAQVVRYGQILRGIRWNQSPPLRGYVDTTPKDRAEVLLSTHKGDPLLATWRYGLGKSAAFTSDVKPRWAADWLEWPGYGKFWSQTARWVMRDETQGAYSVQMSVDGESGRIVIDAVDEDGNFRNFLSLKANVVTPSYENIPVSAQQVSPGRYEGKFEAKETGTYIINIYETEEGKTVASQSEGVSIAYPAEYRSLKPNTFLLNQIAHLTGGKPGLSVEEVFMHNREPRKVPRDIWSQLVMASLFLILLDIASRRIVLPPQFLTAMRKKFSARSPKIGETYPPPNLTILKKKLTEFKETQFIQAPLPESSVPAEDVEVTLSNPEEGLTPSEPVKEQLKENKKEPSSSDYIQRLLQAKRRAKK